ncbi:hypothetical protein MSPP1_000271 [Malassezia sp. CBS 17886]|nr:hypothetical protein MSPP1_000271 [Malassezia sp. CBS 17886]
MSGGLQTVDDAVAMIHAIINTDKESQSWSTYAMQGTGLCVTHVERDGVVAGSGRRAAEERPARAKKCTVRFRFQVTPPMSNMFGTMHGGCVATMIDILSSFVLALQTPGETGTPWSTFGVSQTLSVNYLAPTRLDSWVEVESTTLQAGRMIALLNTDMYELTGKDGDRVKMTATSGHYKIDTSSRSAKM